MPDRLKRLRDTGRTLRKMSERNSLTEKQREAVEIVRRLVERKEVYEVERRDESWERTYHRGGNPI